MKEKVADVCSKFAALDRFLGRHASQRLCMSAYILYFKEPR